MSSTAHQSLAGFGVLVVDDHVFVRSMISKYLHREGFAILEAENGQAALEAIEVHPEFPLKIVIADIVMPIMGGLEMARKLRIDRPELPVLFISGSSLQEIQKSQGAFPERTSLLSKPFSPEELGAKVLAELGFELP